MSNILVIKHGALGDVVLTTGAFAAIRKHHAQARITLLTTRPYAALLGKSGYFDAVWIDERPGLFQVFSLYALMRKIRQGRFTRIYDMQTSQRTAWYFRLMGGNRPQWVGTVKGASHLHAAGKHTKFHTLERQKQQLAVAGIHALPAPDIRWMQADLTRFALPQRYCIVVAGGSPHRPGKRWPASHYAALCGWVSSEGITPVLIGTKAEGTVISTIEAACPGAMNLVGQTGFEELAQLGRGAMFAVGNDTGPMHLIAASGAPSFVLFSEFSDPVLCAPKGNKVVVLESKALADLPPQTVIGEIKKLL